ncbi:hypothetical protein TNIN_32781 [Trichonephila inaurata madagascariensis]|uniref:RNase H type-1 domain-containing protein n=1 Tax=Trichonephila inaurata madagascariensis TaxID=2747483 RepID=A0A8X6YKV3_9ARAC|nr:hypothetical protein TNIN_32781 [Trichonephila inaurata madagascariensis]
MTSRLTTLLLSSSKRHSVSTHRQLQCHLEKFTRAVILTDSKTALLAIVSDNNPITLEILDYRRHLKTLVSLEKSIALQWIPVHCGVSGTEKAVLPAKMGFNHEKSFSSSAFPFCQSFIKKFTKVHAQEDLYNHVSRKS